MSKTAMKLALEALEEIIWNRDSFLQLDAITALREALAEQPAPVQEPVALDGQRKLVQILAGNWRVWPARKAVEQTSLGDVYCSEKGRDLMFGNHEVASDQDSAVVTKEMWSTMRQALAEQPAQQEPLAKDNSNYRLDPPGLDPLYTSPPAQRTWVGLTDIEIQEIWFTHLNRNSQARAIEAKLKEKNT